MSFMPCCSKSEGAEEPADIEPAKTKAVTSDVARTELGDGPSDAGFSKLELMAGVGSWMMCSVGMLVFNKMAIHAFPVACTLVAFQMAFTVLFLVVFTFPSLHIGSTYDVLRWSRVVPFFTGMLLSSILALQYAPMTLVVTFRALSPLVSMAVERCVFPTPLKVSGLMVFSMLMMIAGCVMYVLGMEGGQYTGVYWAILNNFFAIGDRLLQRYMLAKDQKPVDISKTGATLLNNLLGMIPLLAAAFLTNEFPKVQPAIDKLDNWAYAWVAASCFVGVGISYTGIWAQSMISATSFLVLVNANKFAIIFIEAFIMGEKKLKVIQIAGATVAILAGIGYGKARDQIDEEAKKDEPKEGGTTTELKPLKSSSSSELKPA